MDPPVKQTKSSYLGSSVLFNIFFLQILNKFNYELVLKKRKNLNIHHLTNCNDTLLGSNAITIDAPLISHIDVHIHNNRALNLAVFSFLNTILLLLWCKRFVYEKNVAIEPPRTMATAPVLVRVTLKIA